MSLFKQIIATIVFFVMLIGGSYGFWVIGKNISYNFVYKDMVKETVRDMVKQECLK